MGHHLVESANVLVILLGSQVLIGLGAVSGPVKPIRPHANGNRVWRGSSCGLKTTSQVKGSQLDFIDAAKSKFLFVTGLDMIGYDWDMVKDD